MTFSRIWKCATHHNGEKCKWKFERAEFVWSLCIEWDFFRPMKSNGGGEASPIRNSDNKNIAISMIEFYRINRFSWAKHTLIRDKWLYELAHDSCCTLRHEFMKLKFFLKLRQIRESRRLYNALILEPFQFVWSSFVGRTDVKSRKQE